MPLNNELYNFKRLNVAQTNHNLIISVHIQMFTPRRHVSSSFIFIVCCFFLFLCVLFDFLFLNLSKCGQSLHRLRAACQWDWGTFLFVSFGRRSVRARLQDRLWINRMGIYEVNMYVTHGNIVSFLGFYFYFVFQRMPSFSVHILINYKIFSIYAIILFFFGMGKKMCSEC